MPTSDFPTPLIDAATLMRLQAAPDAPVVIDCSFDLTQPEAGAATYAAAHVPGALYAHLDRDLSSAKTGRNGRHPLPTREAFAATVAGWGIAPTTRVVVYDRAGAAYAARAWWMLRWLGHAGVAVLDGGWAAWLAAGGSQEAGVRRATPAAAYPLGAVGMPSVDATQLQARLGRWPLIDARAGERFRGEVEPLDPVAGHIPGALNRPFAGNLGPDGRFLDAAALRAAFDALRGTAEPGEVVHQCGSGVTACHNLLAMEVAGLGGSKLYPGSWSEWCADPARPVARAG